MSAVYLSICLDGRLESRWTWEYGAEGSDNPPIDGAMKTTPPDSHAYFQSESRGCKVSLSQSHPSAQNPAVYLPSVESLIDMNSDITGHNGSQEGYR